MSRAAAEVWACFANDAGYLLAQFTTACDVAGIPIEQRAAHVEALAMLAVSARAKEMKARAAAAADLAMKPVAAPKLRLVQP